MEVNWGVFWAIMLAAACCYFGHIVQSAFSGLWEIFMGEEAREDRKAEKERAARRAAKQQA